MPPPQKYLYDPLQSIPVVSSGDLRADQGKGYVHEVAVACMSFIWVTLRQVCTWGKSLTA